MVLTLDGFDQAEMTTLRAIWTEEPATMSELRFYAACLASYNAGILHGTWIDASTDTDEMQEAINEMLRASPCPNVTVEHKGKQVPSAEEWAAHDYDGAWNLGEYPGLDKIASYVEFIEAADEAGIPHDVAAKVLDNFGADYLDDAKTAISDNFAGAFDSLEDWAEELENDLGELSNVPERLRGYIDFAAIGRDARLGGDIFDIEHDGRLYVFWNR
jgi:antirestriction protein